MIAEDLGASMPLSEKAQNGEGGLPVSASEKGAAGRCCLPDAGCEEDAIAREAQALLEVRDCASILRRWSQFGLALGGILSGLLMAAFLPFWTHELGLFVIVVSGSLTLACTVGFFAHFRH